MTHGNEHDQKFAEEEIDHAKVVGGFPSLDYYEKRIADVYASRSRVALVVVAAELLEIARRQDPAYGVEREQAAIEAKRLSPHGYLKGGVHLA